MKIFEIQFAFDNISQMKWWNAGEVTHAALQMTFMWTVHI